MFSRLAILFLRGFIVILAYTPLSISLFVARTCADLTYLMGYRKRKIMDNLNHVFGDEMPYSRKKEIYFRSHRNLFMTAIEMLRATHPRIQNFKDEVVYPEEHLLHEADANPQSTLFVIAHSGNFDLAGCWWTSSMKRPLWVVAKPLASKVFNDFLVETRHRLGMKVVNSKSDKAIEQINSIIERGEHLCILPDQYARNRGLEVEFLGKKAKTFRGAAATYLRNHDKCQMLLAVPVRLNDSKNHHIHLRKLTDYTPTGEWEKDLFDLTQRICDILGELILEHPESYLWHHGRWGRLRDKKGRLKSTLPQENSQVDQSSA